jgi:hypothetical protein
MMLHGDAWDPDVSGDRTDGVSTASGLGRVHAHWPASANLTAPWGWGTQSKLIHTGETLTWTVWDSGPESSLVTQWKWAVAWFEPNLYDASDIVIYVTDSCHGNIQVASDYSFDFRKRLHLRSSNIGGKCLVMNAHAYKTPTAGTRFYTADYFHSGNADLLH